MEKIMSSYVKIWPGTEDSIPVYDKERPGKERI